MQEFLVQSQEGLYMSLLLLFAGIRRDAIESDQTIGDVYKFTECVEFQNQKYEVVYKKTLHFHTTTTADELHILVLEIIDLRRRAVEQCIFIKTPVNPKNGNKFIARNAASRASRGLFEQ